MVSIGIIIHTGANVVVADEVHGVRAGDLLQLALALVRVPSYETTCYESQYSPDTRGPPRAPDGVVTTVILGIGIRRFLFAACVLIASYT